jgi:SAM-dependent methyltransferase
MSRLRTIPNVILPRDVVRNAAGQLVRSAVGQSLFGTGYAATAPKTSEAAGPETVAYSPSPWWILRWLLPKSEVSSTDVFVEFGCGKGRVVLDAARRYRFRRVVGVELSSELSNVARDLVASEQSRLRCQDVTIETVDATQFEVPDDMTHAYLYNPFYGATFECVIENIIASLDRAPRRIRVIYLHPAHHDTLVATGRFCPVRIVRTTRVVPLARAAIYDAT